MKTILPVSELVLISIQYRTAKILVIYFKPEGV